MSEKRFTSFVEDDGYWIRDENDFKIIATGLKFGVAENLIAIMNEQQATIITLKRRLEKINGGYGHLTHRNGLTANEWLIESQERELKKKNEEISDWIKQHSKDIAKICEQQATIDEQKIIIEERDVANERLNRFLIEMGLEKEYIKWEFKKRCVE